jgi:hypothetical protein
VRARTSRAPTGSGWRTRQARRRWHDYKGGIQRRWHGCAAGRTWRRWLRLEGTICRLRLESEEKLRPEILGAGPGILISEPRFVGSAGDALKGRSRDQPETHMAAWKHLIVRVLVARADVTGGGRKGRRV